VADPVRVFHNPKCSKSRGALEILGERGVDAEIVEYLKAPPDRAALERIVDAIDDPPSALVRIVDAIDDPPSALVRHDARFKELGLDSTAYGTRDAVVGLLLEHPELMERPVVFVGDRAVIARPSEKVLDLLP
jgi:arsenate reductase